MTKAANPNKKKISNLLKPNVHATHLWSKARSPLSKLHMYDTNDTVGVSTPSLFQKEPPCLKAAQVVSHIHTYSLVLCSGWKAAALPWISSPTRSRMYSGGTCFRSGFTSAPFLHYTCSSASTGLSSSWVSCRFFFKKRVLGFLCLTFYTPFVMFFLSF